MNPAIQRYIYIQRVLLTLVILKRIDDLLSQANVEENGATANYSYNTSGRLTSLTHKTSSNSTIAGFIYTHDNVGNRLTKALDTGTKYTYTYDPIYRLTEALSSMPGYSSNTNTKGSGTTTATQQQKEFYTYDPVGNRLSSDKYSAYTYNQANQLLTNGGTYSYDKNGNLTSKTDGTTIYSYSYDYENRLIKVVKIEDGTTTTSDYKYDRGQTLKLTY